MKSMLLSGLCILLLLSGCGWNGTPTRSPEGIVPLTSIEIVPVSSTIAQGTSTTLTARGFYSGVSGGVDITDQVIWSSSDETVAKFNAAPNSNRISGIKNGSVAVSAKVGSVTATYTLTVSLAKITSITVSSVDTSPLPNGLSKQFTANGLFDDGTSQDLTFDAAWSSSDTNVATVTKDAVGKVLVKAVASTGSATIKANFDGVDGIASLTVAAPVLQSIAVTSDNSTIAGSSKTVQFIATGTYSDASTKVITSEVTWTSSLESVATINVTGLATTSATGTTGKTTISAVLGGIIGKMDLTVTALALKTNGLQISPTNPSIIWSSGTITQQLTLTATFADNSTQIVTSSASWTIPAGSSIATVGATTGLVTATSTGTGIVTIQAAYLNQTASSTVTITQ